MVQGARWKRALDAKKHLPREDLNIGLRDLWAESFSTQTGRHDRGFVSETHSDYHLKTEGMLRSAALVFRTAR